MIAYRRILLKLPSGPYQSLSIGDTLCGRARLISTSGSFQKTWRHRRHENIRNWAAKKEHRPEPAVDTPLQPSEKIVTKVHEITIRTIVINQIGL